MAKITQAERDNAATYLAMTRTEVIDAINGFNQEQLEFKPGPQRWSISETIHHLAIVDNLVLRIAENAISAGAIRESAWKDQDEKLLSRVRDRRNKLEAPDIGTRSGELIPSAVISAFDAGREKLIKFVRETEVHLRQYALPCIQFSEIWTAISGF
jgi:DinB superfamily